MTSVRLRPLIEEEFIGASESSVSRGQWQEAANGLLTASELPTNPPDGQRYWRLLCGTTGCRGQLGYLIWRESRVPDSQRPDGEPLLSYWFLSWLLPVAFRRSRGLWRITEKAKARARFRRGLGTQETAVPTLPRRATYGRTVSVGGGYRRDLRDAAQPDDRYSPGSPINPTWIFGQHMARCQSCGSINMVAAPRQEGAS